MIQPVNCIQESQIQQCLTAIQQRVSTQKVQSQQYLAPHQWWVAGSSKRSNQADLEKQANQHPNKMPALP
jgi:hypothetical protein